MIEVEQETYNGLILLFFFVGVIMSLDIFMNSKKDE